MPLSVSTAEQQRRCSHRTWCVSTQELAPIGVRANAAIRLFGEEDRRWPAAAARA